MMNDIYSEGAVFTVICIRCSKKFNVTRNWGGGIRRDDVNNNDSRHNPAICDCGSRRLEIY